MEPQKPEFKGPQLPFLPQKQKEIVALMRQNDMTEIWITGTKEGGTIYSGLNKSGQRVDFNPAQPRL